MITLSQALNAAPWRLLLVIGRQRGLGLDSNLRKADLVTLLPQTLLDPGNLRQTLAALPAEAEQALIDLLLAGGRSPVRYLQARYGYLRPSQQMIRAYRRQTSLPTHSGASLSPLEQLCLLGLVFHDRAANDLFIPGDLIPHLPAPDASPPPPPIVTAKAYTPIDLVCHDLAYLLALLQRDDIRPLHGRWLPPRFLASWGQCCLTPPVSPAARSELQTGRRRFLHYLAENARWLPPTSSDLKPTPAAWLRLKAAHTERLQTLWNTWTVPDPDLWRTFRLPGHDWLTEPAALLTPIHRGLSEIDPADPALFAETLLRGQPDLQDLVPANMLDRFELLIGTMTALLTGPLTWLGVLSEQGGTLTGAGRGAGGQRGGGAGGQGSGEEIPPAPQSLAGSPSAALVLTPQGQAWLAGQPLATADVPLPAKFSLKTEIQPDPLHSTLTLSLKDGLPDPADLAAAVELSEAESVVEVQTAEVSKTSEILPRRYDYQITAPTFIRALHHGWSPPALLDALDRLAGRPLTGQETALLRSWAEAADRITIGHTTILETTDPGVISRLASTRRGRALISRTLSPRAVVVNPARLDKLVRRLTRQEDVPPRVQGSRGAGAQGGRGAGEQGGRGAGAQGRGGAGGQGSRGAEGPGRRGAEENNPQSAIRSPQSKIQNPKSAIRNPKSDTWLVSATASRRSGSFGWIGSIRLSAYLRQTRAASPGASEQADRFWILDPSAVRRPVQPVQPVQLRCLRCLPVGLPGGRRTGFGLTSVVTLIELFAADG